MLIIWGNLVNTILKAVWAEDGGSPHGLVVDGERLPPRTKTVSCRVLLTQDGTSIKN